MSYIYLFALIFLACFFVLFYVANKVYNKVKDGFKGEIEKIIKMQRTLHNHQLEEIYKMLNELSDKEIKNKPGTLKVVKGLKGYAYNPSKDDRAVRSGKVVELFD